jgi:hypothetical protein
MCDTRFALQDIVLFASLLKKGTLFTLCGASNDTVLTEKKLV